MGFGSQRSLLTETHLSTGLNKYKTTLSFPKAVPIGISYPMEDAMELREMKLSYKVSKRGPKVKGPNEVVEYLRAAWDKNTIDMREEFLVVYLDGNHQILGHYKAGQGSLNLCQIHPRDIFTPALLSNAAALVLAHNHPSGELSPSREDKAVTADLKAAGALLGIPVLDHVILSRNGYVSFKEMGILNG